VRLGPHVLLLGHGLSLRLMLFGVSAPDARGDGVWLMVFCRTVA